MHRASCRVALVGASVLHERQLRALIAEHPLCQRGCQSRHRYALKLMKRPTSRSSSVRNDCICALACQGEEREEGSLISTGQSCRLSTVTYHGLSPLRLLARHVGAQAVAFDLEQSVWCPIVSPVLLSIFSQRSHFSWKWATALPLYPSACSAGGTLSPAALAGGM